MLGRIATWFTATLLQKSTLSIKDRSRLLNAINTKLDVVPITDIISFNGDGSISVNGALLTNEMIIRLREGARAALNNSALKFIHDQTTYEALKIGVYKATDDQSILFAKAALWHGTKVRELLNQFAEYATTQDIGQELNPN